VTNAVASTKKPSVGGYTAGTFGAMVLLFIPAAVEQIHKSPTAIFSQPTFLTNNWTTLFEKETWKEKPLRLRSNLRCSTMPRMWKEKSTEMSCVQSWFTRILGLLWHYSIIIIEEDPQNSTRNSEESSENGETFPSSKFDPATGVMIDWCCF